MSLAHPLTPAILNPGKKAGKNWRVHLRTPALTELPISENGFSKRGTDVASRRPPQRHGCSPRLNRLGFSQSDSERICSFAQCANGRWANRIGLGSQRNGRNLACSAFVKRKRSCRVRESGLNEFAHRNTSGLKLKLWLSCGVCAGSRGVG